MKDFKVTQDSSVAADPVLDIRNLRIAFGRGAIASQVVNDVSLSIRPGEIHAVVGESGSGKTMIARSILQLLPPGAAIIGGSINFGGRPIHEAPEEDMRGVRGAEIGMIFQEPLTSLNPSLRIGRQMAEAMHLHTKLSKEEIRAKSIEMLQAVRIPDPEDCLSRYPHEFSGGMRQRIMIASVMMLRPRLLIADEPTTALDAVVQRDVLEIMADVARRFDTAVLLVTHDLGVVARYADRTTVMNRGDLVESGATAEILSVPSDAYTRRLLDALPTPPDLLRERTPQEPVIKVEELEISYSRPAMLPFRPPVTKRVVKGVTFDIEAGEMLGLVGESGSGKSTIGRALVALKEASGGRVTYRGQDIAQLGGSSLRRARTNLQVVFQDPFSSLNPRMKVEAIIGEGLRHVPDLSARDAKAQVAEIIEAVGLDSNFRHRFVHELSGGQRQRVAIARALVSRPEFVVADEPVSALDMTVQAQILDLFRDLRESFGFACLFISHDLGVVESLCDRVLVMHTGFILEQATAVGLFSNPRHPYTRQLMAATPRLLRSGAGYHLRESGDWSTQEPERDFFWPPRDTEEGYCLSPDGPGHFVARTATA